jgi:hypothetical protein
MSEDKNLLQKLGLSGQQIADKAIAAAVSQLISTMKYASQKIAEADEDLPDETILRVTASAVLVELALEVPVKEIVKNGQNSTRGSDEVVREEVQPPIDADDPGSSES